MELRSYFRKGSIILLTALMVLMCSCAGSGSGTAPADQKQYIGIISAMDNEIDLLLDEAEIDGTEMIGDDVFHVGTLCGQPVVIVRSGIGKVNSASTITAMLNNYDISKVIFTGIAGGVGDDTEVLDIVIATGCVQHDYGLVTDDGFDWKSSVSGEKVGDEGYFDCDDELVDLAYDAAVDVVGADHSFKGIIASGDQFISSEEYVEMLQERFNAIACEMEGAAVASVCTAYKTPLVIIRAMSDKADGKAHETYDNMGDIAAENSNRIVIEMLESM